ncbi:MAG: hypothetical protein EXS25_08915 [Pedosphaera sp.]|nr:hypothetical protein [Pedosphaera sp.]
MKLLPLFLIWNVLNLCPLLRLLGADVATPPVEAFFGLDRLWSFHLSFSGEEWADLQPIDPLNGQRPTPGFGPGPVKREYPWSQAAFTGAGYSFPDLRLRFKGNSSYNMSHNSWKRPFKLDFNRGNPSRKLEGQKELLLNNNVNDGTQFREALAYQLFRAAGVPAPRTAFAQVHLSVSGQCTNLYLGLYTVVEAVESGFLKERFGSAKGLLLKPERVQGLAFLGSDWAAYEARYCPKGESTKAERERFVALTRLVEDAADADFVSDLPNRLDVESFLTFLAVNAVLANYDSFLGMGHNYYLFQPANLAPLRFIPWDLNEAFGGHPGLGGRAEQATFSVLQPQASQNRLVERILAYPVWSNQYRQILSRLMTVVISPTRLTTMMNLASKTVREAVIKESPRAAVTFRRSLAIEQEAKSKAPVEGPEARRNEGVLVESPELRPSGPVGGFRGGMRDDISFQRWWELREKWVREELDGSRVAPVARMRMRPRPSGPNRLSESNRGGRPEGLVRPSETEDKRNP